MTIDMSQFYQVFFDEADELLAEMEKLLLAIDVSAPDSEDLNAIFRAAHSIKGGAATFAFNDITEVTHMLESLLDRIRKNEMALTPEHVEAFLVSKDVLAMQMDGHHHGSSVDQAAVDSVCLRLKALSQGILAEAPAAVVSPAPGAAPDPSSRCRTRLRMRTATFASVSNYPRCHSGMWTRWRQSWACWGQSARRVWPTNAWCSP